MASLIVKDFNNTSENTGSIAVFARVYNKKAVTLVKQTTDPRLYLLVLSNRRSAQAYKKISSDNFSSRETGVPEFSVEC